MTECTSNSLQFSSLSRKKILADFDGGHLTSDGGALLLREANRRTGLINALAECITDPREPAKIKHDVKTMLTQRICGIALGDEDGNDHQTLRSDPMMQMLAEMAPDPDDPLASPPTLCRFENWVNRKSLARMSAVFVDQFIASYRKPPKEIILDFDATEDAIHGQQEHRFFHGYMIATASCRCMCSAEINCCVPICDQARSMGRSTLGGSSSSWFVAFANHGPRCGSSSVAIPASVAGKH